MSPNPHGKSGTRPKRKIVPVVPRSLERQVKTQQEREGDISTDHAHNRRERKAGGSDEGKAGDEQDQSLQIEISGDLSQNYGSQEADAEEADVGKP